MGDKSKQALVEFDEGAVMYNTSTTGDIYFAVYAPNVSTVFSGTTYNFQVAASVDGWYHSFSVSTSTPTLSGWIATRQGRFS